MNLLKPLAIRFGSKFIADKLYQYANQIEGVENQLRLQIKRILIAMIIIQDPQYEIYITGLISINAMPATELADF